MNIKPIYVEYRDHMGSDLTVVNAARASFGKEVTEFKESDANLIKFLATGYRSNEWKEFINDVVDLSVNSQFDLLEKLLKEYKRKAQHWAPFGHPHIQLRLQMPIFLARQFVKHQVGGVWSEESRRYIDNEPDVWFPNEWHCRPNDIKQGSGNVIDQRPYLDAVSKTSTRQSITAYKELRKEEVAPEEARIVLPLNMMTTVVWTGSLLFWSRVVNQRLDPHAQLAAQELAALISNIIEPLFPVSWKSLTT